MLHKIRGIVLKTTAYSESSVVAQIFTDKFGLQSYLIQGVKKPKSKIKMNMLQPLHLLEMVAPFKPNSALQKLTEARPGPAFSSIPYDIIKSTMVIFINEVLYKSIRQQTSEEQLFEFLQNAILWLDEDENINNNFHLALLLKLSRYLGFAPNTSCRSDQAFFDLQEGEFKTLNPGHQYFLKRDEADMFLALYETSFENLTQIKITNLQRRALLEKILIYYKLHTASFGDVQSHSILEEILV